MDCDFVQEWLSAFLDHEEGTDNIDSALTHLYVCESCQNFFNAAVKLRSVAGDDKEVFPVELDEVISRGVNERQRNNFLNYRLRLPAFVVSTAAVILIAISFAFGFMVNRSMSEHEIQQALTSHGIYVMPQQTVYPVSVRQYQGESR